MSDFPSLRQRLGSAIREIVREDADLSKYVLVAHPITLRALAWEVSGNDSWKADRPGVSFTSIGGIPVKEDKLLETGRLVLRHEVEC